MLYTKLMDIAASILEAIRCTSANGINFMNQFLFAAIKENIRAETIPKKPNLISLSLSMLGKCQAERSNIYTGFTGFHQP